MKTLYLRQRFWIWCLRRLLKLHTHQSRVSSEDLATVDTYWIYFRAVPESKSVLIEDQQAAPDADNVIKYYVEPLERSKGLTARQVRKDPGDPEKPRFQIKPETLRDAAFEIRHFFKEIETTFDSPFTALLWRSTKLHWVLLATNRMLGRWYYRNVRLVKDRAVVLRSVIKQEDERSMHISVRTVVNDIYGNKYQKVHPSKRVKVNDTIHRVLESLVYSGELTRQESRFKTTGKCLASLSEWETDLRRHRHEKIREFLMLMATVIIAIGTMIQATS